MRGVPSPADPAPDSPAQGRPRASEFVFARLRYDSGDWDYNPKVAANNLQEFVAKARANPEKFNFATGGYGSAGHMAAESFKLEAGLKVPMVLYRGTAPAFNDLAGGHISGLLDPLVTSLPLVLGKKATALAIASDEARRVGRALLDVVERHRQHCLLHRRGCEEQPGGLFQL